MTLYFAGLWESYWRIFFSSSVLVLAHQAVAVEMKNIWSLVNLSRPGSATPSGLPVLARLMRYARKASRMPPLSAMFSP
uniref:Putative secreted protein n=1 Tax=Ixodes ricinus TaxID=34613 RepID=A0A6B0U594_IXORI